MRSDMEVVRWSHARTTEREMRLRKIERAERDEDFSRYLLSIFIIEPLAILQNYIIVPLYYLK